MIRSQCEALIAAIHRAGEFAVAIKAEFADLDRHQLAKVTRAFQRALIPPRRRGRKRQPSITRAVNDYIIGIRGVQLYRCNIRGWEHMSKWRRAKRAVRLVNAIYKRLSRAKPKTAA